MNASLKCSHCNQEILPATDHDGRTIAQAIQQHNCPKRPKTAERSDAHQSL